MKKILYIFVSVLVFTVGCSDQAKKYLPFSNSSGDATVQNGLVGSGTLTEIRVSPANAQIAKDTYGVFRAEGIYSNGNHRDITSEVTWSTSDTTVSESTTTKGRVSGKKAGASQVIATSGTLTGSGNLTVTNATITTITVTSSATQVASNTSTQYTAIAVFSDGTTQDITTYATWSTGSATVATVVSNDPVTAGQVTGVTAGNTTVVASFTPSGSTPVTSNNSNLQVTTATLVSIQITGNLNPARGTLSQLTATGIFSDGSNQDITTQVTWASSNVGVATQSNTSGTKGMLTAISQGTTSVTASLNGVTGTANVTVPASAPTIVSIAISGTVSLINGLGHQYTATATYSDGTTVDVTKMAVWNSSSNSVATIVSDLTNGGAMQSVGVGSTNITATFGGVTSNVSVVTVTNPSLVSIAITPSANQSVNAGGTLSFTATGTYSNNTTANITSAVTWNSSSVAAATISNAADTTKGRVTGIAAGSSNITASLDGRTSNSVALTVTATSTLVSIAITPSVTTTVAGLTTTAYTATATYSNGTTADVTSFVTWNSSSTSTATISNAADASVGRVTGVAAGSTNITATLNGVTSNTVPFTVTGAALTSISINAPATSVIVGMTTNAFTAIGHYDNGTTVDITSSVTWNSSATGNATISNVADATKGKATGVSVGATNISASLGAINSSSVALNVVAATLTSIAITPTNPSNLIVGMTQTTGFTATGTYNNGTTANITSSVTWNSSNTGNGTIDNTATANKGKVTGVSAGTTSISATDPTTNITSNSVTLTVDAATLVSINITGDTSVAFGNQTAAYVAMGTYNDGLAPRDISGSVTWSSSDTAKATISGATKRATGVYSGTTNISASLSGVTSNSITLTVQAVLASVTVTPATPSVTVGGTQQFTATANYNGGASSNITNTATWTSSNTGFATITTGGLATGVAAGSPTITATFSGMSGNATLTVNAAVTLTSISISPRGDTVSTGFTKQYTATGTYSNGTTANITNTVTWASSDTGKATISNAGGSNGLASPVASGATTISATLGAVSDSTTLTVNAITLTGIYIGANATYPAGVTKQYTAWGNFSDGSKVDISSQVTWASSSTSAATISNASGSNGLASTVAAGSTTISAVKSGITGSATLTVKAENETAVTDNFTGSVTNSIPIDLIVKDQNGVAVSGVIIKIYDASSNGYVLFQALSDGSGRVTGTLPIQMNSSSIFVYGQAYKGGYTSSMQAIEIVKDVSGTLKVMLLLKDFVLDTTIAALNALPITDTDGDGVEDANDAYPSDATKAFKTRFPSMRDKVYSLNIENNWPNPTNRDLNDYTVQFYNEEDTNATGGIVEIRGNYQIIVRGRYDYESQTLQLRLPGLGISEYKATYYRYDGTQRPSSWTVSTVSGGVDTALTVNNPLTITNPTAAQLKDNLVLIPKTSSNATTDVLLNNAGAPSTHSTGGYSSTFKTFRPGDIGRVSIKLTSPATRDEVGNAPYDLYLRYFQTPSTSGSAKEIHVAGSGYVWASGDSTYCPYHAPVEADSACVGKDKYKSDNIKFAWGTIVPGVWKPQVEGKNLNSSTDSAYPKYLDWINSSGNTYTNWYKAANIVNSNAYQILPKPNKYLCLDCAGADTYDPGTAGNDSGKYYCSNSTGTPTGCVLGDLPTSYATTADVAFVDQIIEGGSQLMAYLAKSAKSGTARGAAAAIVLLVGAILASRIWRNSRNNK